MFRSKSFDSIFNKLTVNILTEKKINLLVILIF